MAHHCRISNALKTFKACVSVLSDKFQHYCYNIIIIIIIIIIIKIVRSVQHQNAKSNRQYQCQINQCTAKCCLSNMSFNTSLNTTYFTCNLGFIFDENLFHKILSSTVTLIPSGLPSRILTCTELKGHWRLFVLVSGYVCQIKLNTPLSSPLYTPLSYLIVSTLANNSGDPVDIIISCHWYTRSCVHKGNIQGSCLLKYVARVNVLHIFLPVFILFRTSVLFLFCKCLVC